MAGALQATVRLMRPAQWPILTCQLAVGVVLANPSFAGPAWPDMTGPNVLRLFGAWLSWVVLLNGGTLAYNSAFDRDVGPVAFLATPPRPPRGLAGMALATMITGVAVGWWLVGAFVAVLVGSCALLSILYSHPATRWKAIPGLDLLTNVLGYGVGTTLAGMSAGGNRVPSGDNWWLAAGFGLLFGSFYPLTQIYQVKEDLARGDRTLTTALGVPRVLDLALGLGILAGAVFWRGIRLAGETGSVWLPFAATLLWCAHIARWRWLARRWQPSEHERAMYGALALWAVVDLALGLTWLRSVPA